MQTVSDIMRREVIAFRPDTTLGEAIAILSEQNISGAPVLSEEGKLVGVISEFALMDVLFDPELKDAKVSQYMTREVHCLTEKDSLTQAVHMFAIYRVRRLPVMRDEELAGIITRRDLMTLCLTLKEPLAEPLEELMQELSSVPTDSVENVCDLVDFA